MESRLVRMVLVVVFSVVFVGGSACAERGRGDGRSIRKAMDFLARRGDSRNKWPYKQITRKEIIAERTYLLWPVQQRGLGRGN